MTSKNVDGVTKKVSLSTLTPSTSAVGHISVDTDLHERKWRVETVFLVDIYEES